ncbi:MAG: biotin/lipoyl-binding protein [Pirellulales bacterium]
MSPVFRLVVCSLLVAVPVFAQDAEKSAGPRVVKIEPAILTVIDQAEIPAHDAGVLQKLNVVEGQRVAAGDALVELDQDEERTLREKAAVEAAVAAKQLRQHVRTRIRAGWPTPRPRPIWPGRWNRKRRSPKASRGPNSINWRWRSRRPGSASRSPKRKPIWPT